MRVVCLTSPRHVRVQGGKEATRSNALLHKLIVDAVAELAPGVGRDLIGLVTSRDEIDQVRGWQAPQAGLGAPACLAGCFCGLRWTMQGRRTGRAEALVGALPFLHLPAACQRQQPGPCCSSRRAQSDGCCPFRPLSLACSC